LAAAAVLDWARERSRMASGSERTSLARVLTRHGKHHPQDTDKLTPQPVVLLCYLGIKPTRQTFFTRNSSAHRLSVSGTLLTPNDCVFSDDDGHVRSYQLRMLTEGGAQGLIAADRQQRNGQLRSSEIGEIFGSLRPRGETDLDGIDCHVTDQVFATCGPSFGWSLSNLVALLRPSAEESVSVAHARASRDSVS